MSESQIIEDVAKYLAYEPYGHSIITLDPYYKNILIKDYGREAFEDALKYVRRSRKPHK